MNSVRFVDDRMNTIVFVLFTQTASAACLPVRASNDSLNENKKMKTNANSVCIEFTCTAAVSAACSLLHISLKQATLPVAGSFWLRFQCPVPYDTRPFVSLHNGTL